MKTLLKVVIVLAGFSLARAQVVLQPWTEVYGTVNGQQLGKYVTGITPSANLPYKAAVSKVGSTGIYRLNTPNDTSARQIFFGENLLTGDLNNDGFKDVVVGKTVNNYDTVYVYWGTNTGLDTLNPLKIANENHFDGLKPGFIGDVNNDGKPDLVLLAPDYPNLSSLGKLYVFSNPVTGIPISTITGDSVNFFLGVSAVIGDLNQDGLNDLIVRGNMQRGPQMNRYDYVNIYWGVGTDTVNTRLGLQLKTRTLAVAALACFDINGDAKPDLLWTTADSTGRRYINVHYGSTMFDTIPNLRLRDPIVDNFGYAITNGHDMNGDGYNDAVIGCPDASFGNGFVLVYGGGPRIDDHVDAFAEMTLQGRFGQTVSSVGDVNGDGISDIIVGAPAYAFFQNRGYWGIFKGDSTIRVTDVAEPATIPREYNLDEAYPNPFNPLTIIGFGLQSAAHVTIEVFDQLGRAVRRLVNREYSPGHYTTTFDALGLSSGVYYYRMTVRTKEGKVFTQTKKTLLLSERDRKKESEDDYRLYMRASNIHLVAADTLQRARERQIVALRNMPEYLKTFLAAPDQKPDTILYMRNATIYFYDKDISRLKEILR